MVQRDGDLRLRMLERLTSDRIGEVLAENAELTCRLITDDMSSYRRPGTAFRGGHEFVTHSRGEYVRPGTDVHSNTIEGVAGSTSRTYLNEFEFRWNTRS